MALGAPQGRQGFDGNSLFRAAPHASFFECSNELLWNAVCHLSGHNLGVLLDLLHQYCLFPLRPVFHDISADGFRQPQLVGDLDGPQFFVVGRVGGGVFGGCDACSEQGACQQQQRELEFDGHPVSLCFVVPAAAMANHGIA